MPLHRGRPLTVAEVVDLLSRARHGTDLLIGHLSDEDLRQQHDPLMSPIVWDLGHIAHFEEVWLLENVDSGSTGSEGLRGLYNPFENPRAVRDGLPLPSLRECRVYMAAVRSRVTDRLQTLDLASPAPLLRDGFVFRMVLQHEYQHNETVLQTLQLKKGAPYSPPERAAHPQAPSPDAPAPGSMVRVPGGCVVLGTDDRSEAYDNERPAHRVSLGPFWMDVHPVTNGQFREFVEDGGYSDPAHWSPAGRTWLNDSGVSAPKHWMATEQGTVERTMDVVRPLDPLRPVCHVCFFEAEAYSRWAGKRLPTEAEWEAAASWDFETDRKSPYPWGEQPPSESLCNLDARLFATTAVGSYPRGVSPAGCWGMIGDVWEWTSSGFSAYPGYETFPYPEYSEAFFGDEYRVLRGGSWATRAGAVRGTFRNWDYPIRRQIFSGFRCARDD